MSNKTFIRLLSTNFLFIFIAIVAFLLSGQDARYHDPSQERANQEKFDRFVADVRGGKVKVTADQWIEGMRAQREQTKSERRIAIHNASAMRIGGWYVLLAVACQTLVVLSVGHRLRKTNEAAL